ncbi:MAG TPA: HNH endonuclease [Bacteroidetes bacterium]|nr:HNH endonuclease [Bacteroidota bacterium]HIL58169.1 HNH endonuclease [Rhodothermales bacterium]
MSAYPQPVRVRFWARVDRTTTPEGCWPWTGALSVGGYGRFTVDGRTRGSHVWALVLGGVAVPEGAVVRHLCGNPACCRPEHLSAEGGQRENNLDTVEHGRHRSAALDGRRVRAMRERYAEDRPPLADLASEHGVSESAVSAALTGRTWPRAGGPLKRSRKRTPDDGGRR